MRINPGMTSKIRSRVWQRMILTTMLMAVIAAVVGVQGCSTWIAYAIVQSPNSNRSFDSDDDLTSPEAVMIGLEEQLRIDVGPPSASLSVWIVNPPLAANRSAISPKATVVVLHGIRDSKRSQISLAKSLAALGYRAVLIDLRGHGLSTGQWLTYGVVESRDLIQVLDELAAQDLLAEPVGVVGASYGAAIAIQHAAKDPRIKAVVAIAPFASLPDLVPQYLRLYGIGWAVSDATIERALDKAQQLASFDAPQASPLQAIGQSDAQILLIHGRADQHIPCEHSRRLHAAAPDQSRLLLIDDDDHTTIMSDRSGLIAREMSAWFDMHLCR